MFAPDQRDRDGQTTFLSYSVEQGHDLEQGRGPERAVRAARCAVGRIEGTPSKAFLACFPNRVPLRTHRGRLPVAAPPRRQSVLPYGGRVVGILFLPATYAHIAFKVPSRLALTPPAGW